MTFSSVFGDPNAYFGNIVYGLDEAGSGTTTGTCTLFISGHIPSSGYCDLFIEGSGGGSTNGALNLYVRGGPDPVTTSGAIPLYLAGPGSSGLSSVYNFAPLSIEGYQAGSSGSLNLYINGFATGSQSGNLNLVVKAEEPNSTASIPLYLQNNGAYGGITLYTIAGGFINPTASIDPVVAGSGTGSLNLFIARSNSNEQLTLFLQGTPDTASGTLPLYVLGGVNISSGIPLYTYGIETPSGLLPMYVRGY